MGHDFTKVHRLEGLFFPPRELRVVILVENRALDIGVKAPNAKIGNKFGNQVFRGNVGPSVLNRLDEEFLVHLYMVYLSLRIGFPHSAYSLHCFGGNFDMGSNKRLDGARDEVSNVEPLRDFELCILVSFFSISKVKSPSSPGLLDDLALD